MHLHTDQNRFSEGQYFVKNIFKQHYNFNIKITNTICYIISNIIGNFFFNKVIGTNKS